MSGGHYTRTTAVRYSESALVFLHAEKERADVPIESSRRILVISRYSRRTIYNSKGEKTGVIENGVGLGMDDSGNIPEEFVHKVGELRICYNFPQELVSTNLLVDYDGGELRVRIDR